MLEKNNTKNSVIKLFEKSGNGGDQVNLLKMFKDIFVNTTLDQFKTVYLDAIMSVIVTEGTIHCENINNMIKFGANGVAVIIECLSKDCHSGLYVISYFLQHCRKLGSSNLKAIRWRFCLFFNHLLNFMSEGSLLTEELCDVTTVMLLKRLKDKKPEIRVQAAHALHRLQSPDNSSCKIVEQFLYHMTSDPSVEVRTAIVRNIAKFHHVVDEMLKHTLNDMSDNVRKEAYNCFLIHPFESFSAKQRITVLEKGLKDTNENIVASVKGPLLDDWMSVCGDNIVILLEYLGVENESMCETVLSVMFASYYDDVILNMVNDILNCDTRMINFNKLTVEKIFFWKCVAKHLTKEKKIELARKQGHTGDDYFDVLLPSLVHFSGYVREYFFNFNSESDKEFILTQLLDMARTFEIDDVGSESLNKLCFDLILHPQTSVKHIKPIVVLLNLTLKNSHDILNYVKEILNEIQKKTIDVCPLITKVGAKELLDHKMAAIKKKIEESVKNNDIADSNRLNELTTTYEGMEMDSKDFILLPEELTLADLTEKSLLKGLELVYQVQQLMKIHHEHSLLGDIIQNVIVGYLDCKKTNLRMAAFRSLTPHMLVNGLVTAQEYITLLCGELAFPLTDKRLVLEIMFELILRYDVKVFGMNEDLDTGEGDEKHVYFSVGSVLPLLVSCIDYEVDDNNFKSVVVKGFCNLLTFKKIKSINLISKLMILWFRRATHESSNLHTALAKYFTTFVFYTRSSSSTLAKCYVPALKEIDENDMITKLDFKVDELNTAFINLTEGLMFKDEKTAINAHGELAGYILDYLLDEQPYTNMLVDTLYKLNLHFDGDNDLINTLRPKLLRVIKHLKIMESDKNASKYLKKLKSKFDPVLNKKASFAKQSNKTQVDMIEVVPPQVSSCSYQEPDHTIQISVDPSQEPPQISKEQVEIHGDLFAQDHILESLSSDDEDDEAHPQLDVIKRMSEIFKRSYLTINDDTNDSD